MAKKKAESPKPPVVSPAPKKVAAVGNPLVEASFRINPLELKLVLFVASLIHDEHDFYTYSFRVEDFANAIGRKMTPEFYSRFRDLGRTILKRLVVLENFVPEEGAKPRSRDTTWFRYFDYYDDEGRVEICLHDFLQPLLLDLKNEFTRLVVRDVGKLTSFYGMKLYMLLEQYRTIGQRCFLVSDLREAMGVESHEYPSWYEFNRWVLSAAISDLRKADILEVDMEFKKNGRKIHKVIFTFYTPGSEKNVTPSVEEKERQEIIAANASKYFSLLQKAKAGILDFGDENDEQSAEEQAFNALKNEIKKPLSNIGPKKKGPGRPRKARPQSEGPGF